MQTGIIATLRAQISAIEQTHGTSPLSSCLPFGVPRLDACLPGQGLATGAVHELFAGGPAVEHGAAPALFVAAVLARRTGPVLWIMARRDLYSPALARAGLDPTRLVFIHARRGALRAMEESLRHPGLAGVVCEHEGRLDLVASRRLQLAAEATGALGFILRRSPRFDDPALSAPSAAATRWRITALPRLRRCPMPRTCPAWAGRSGSWSCCAAAAPRPPTSSWRVRMRGVVSLFLPTWPTDRLRRHSHAGLPADQPLVTRTHDGRRMVIAAADAAARVQGLRPSMPLAHATAMVPDLMVLDADPHGDQRALAGMVLPLFAAADARGRPEPEIVEPPTLLAPMRDGEEVVEDYRSTGLSLRSHPVAFLRAELQTRGMVTCADLAHTRDGRRIVVSGIVLVRQKPGSAKGVMFITIGDETGVANLILWPDRYAAQRRLVLQASMLACHGRVQREGEVMHVITDRLEDLSDLLRSVGERDATACSVGSSPSLRRGLSAGLQAGMGMDAPTSLSQPGTSIRVPTRDFR